MRFKITPPQIKVRQNQTFRGKINDMCSYTRTCGAVTQVATFATTASNNLSGYGVVLSLKMVR